MTLHDIEPELKTINSSEVRRPSMPMPNALQEAHDLLELCRNQRVLDALVSVGVARDAPRQLEQRINAAREAQSQWVAVRDRTKSAELVEVEARATELRSDMLAAARWSLRDAREAQTTLDTIRAGEGVADLVQDLFDLATLCERHQEAFAGDQSFDVAVNVAAARQVGQRLSLGVSEGRLDPEPTGTRDVRDRAFTYMDNLVSELRSAGRYALRRDADTRKLFTSRYRRRARRGVKRSEPPAQEVVEEEVVGEIVAA
jgi:hypothetical protein